jgi:hypothetical protein
MKKIESVKELKRLAHWFYGGERYTHFKNAPLEFIVDELSKRRCIRHAIDTKAVNQVDIDDWLSSEKSNEVYEKSADQNIVPLYASSLGMTNLEMVGSDYTAYVGLALEHATDEEILKELKQYLIRVRDELSIPEPKRNRKVISKVKSFTARGLWQFIDLTLWAELYGYSFTDDFLVVVIGIGHTPKTISDQLRNDYMKEALSYEFSEQLINLSK